VAAAVDSVPGVRRTFGSGVVAVSTAVPGGLVEGVALGDEVVSVCVALSRLPVPAVAGEIAQAARAALKEVGDKRRVDVVVDDLDLEELPAFEALAELATLAAPPARRRPSRRRAPG
jgi:hypothetical protein